MFDAVQPTMREHAGPVALCFGAPRFDLEPRFPPQSRIVAITGGRDHEPSVNDCELIVRWLERSSAVELRHGAARGVDTIVSRYVARRAPGLVIRACRADWQRYGKAAGSIRNRRMLAGYIDGGRYGPADYLIAFPGGAGTDDCRRQAQAMGVHVLSIEAIRAKLSTATAGKAKRWSSWAMRALDPGQDPPPSHALPCGGGGDAHAPDHGGPRRAS